MTASFAPIDVRFRPGRLLPQDGVARQRRHTFAAFALGFFAFLPFPALPVGNNSAVQLGTLVTFALCASMLFARWKDRPYYLALVIYVPLVLSAAKVALTQEAGLNVSFKTLFNWTLPLLTLLPAQRYAPRYLMSMLAGIASVTLFHVAVGCWQEYVFLNGGELPLLWAYVNPSYFSVPAQAFIIVHYIRRPFGLFSEPSAMSSSLAPWVLLFIAELCGLIRFPSRPTRVQRGLFTAAAVGGLMLIISSRSGHAIVTLAAVVAFGAMWLKKARATPGNFLLTLAVFGIVLPLAVWLTILALGNRVVALNGMNESWQDRSNSLIVGFKLWIGTDWSTMLFGMGIGQSAPAVVAHSEFDAVWSVLLCYIYETGIIGCAAVGWVGYVLWRGWRKSGSSMVFAAIFFVWLVGVTLTTSYNQLLPIWLTLGTLMVWPAVFPPVEGHRSGRRSAAGSDRLRSDLPTGPSDLVPNSQPRSVGLSLTPWGRELL